MCGRAYQPRFMFTWPSGRCSVIGPGQLAGVMDIVQSVSAAKKNLGKAAKAPSSSYKAGIEKFRQRVEKESQAYYTSANLLDDGIIDPRDTREVLGICLNVVHLDSVQGAQTQKGPARL